MKKRFRRQGMDRAKRAKWSIMLGSFVTLLVAGLVTLITCAYAYHWTWAQISYWLNPFADGNDWAWLVYAALIGITFILIWLIHKTRVERILNDE